MKTIALLGFILLLAGCATVGESVLKAGTTGANRFSREDVEAAIVIAQNSKDPIAEACFKAISKNLDVAPEMITKGAVSSYAAARAGIRASRAPLAEEVHVACAPLVVDAGNFASRLGVTLGTIVAP